MPTLNLRIPEKLHERLKVAAETDHRSINAEITVALEEFLDRKDARR